MLIPLTVSSDGPDFWIARGQRAQIFTQQFTLWVHQEQVEGTEQFTVSWRKESSGLRLEQGGLSQAQEAAGWSRLLTFWAWSGRRPGLEAVTATRGQDDRLTITRGQGEWAARSTVFWALLPPARTSLACRVRVVVDSALLHHFEGSLQRATERVREVFVRLNTIFSSSVFSDYGLQFQVSEVTRAEHECEGKGCGEVEELLEWFTQQEAGKEACLKYLFTYSEFQGGTTGLGWKGSICGRKRKTR